MRYLVILLVTICLVGATASQVNTYINGQTLTATQLNSEFSNLYTTINTLDDANISTTAGILPIKLDATIEGNAMSRQADGSLDVAVDASTVKIVANQLAIVDLPGSALVTGAVASAQILDNTIAKVDIAVRTSAITATLGNVGLSASTGAGVITHLTGASGDLSNNLVNLTTQGGPVMVSLAAGVSGTDAYLECEEVTTDPCIIEMVRGGVTIFEVPFFTEGGIYRLPPGAFNFIDVIGAGTYEYKIKYSVPSATALRVLNVRLMAYEL